MISKHISDKEGVYSTTATRRGLDNNPSQFELANMKELAEQIFEPLREWVSGPIRINSFYRGDRKSTRLNSSHLVISYAVFCLKKKTHQQTQKTN